jgi:hypothetical protein
MDSFLKLLNFEKTTLQESKNTTKSFACITSLVTFCLASFVVGHNMHFGMVRWVRARKIPKSANYGVRTHAYEYIRS